MTAPNTREWPLGVTRLIRRASDEVSGAGTASLPGWFTANRVHGHTRLLLRLWGDKPEAAAAAAKFKALGAEAFTRHAKSGDEDPPWPAGDPPGPNVVKEFIDRAHAEGLRIFTYYWHMSEKSLEAPHPEWVCKNRDGTAIEGKRGVQLDITGPYREVVLRRLRELAAMGADGFFFDERHLPPRGCWGSAFAQAFQARTGQEPPAPNDDDPLYQQFLDFKAEKIEETFAYWRDHVKADYPDVVFIVSTTTIPALTDREMTTRLARLADSAKNEYKHALSAVSSKCVFDAGDLLEPEDHVRQALGWTVLRDGADGRPPHIWARGVPNIDHAQAYAGSLLTFGCIANMDVHEFILVGKGDLPEIKTPPEALAKAFALGKTASPHLAGTKPVRWAAVHFGERSRNSRGGDFRAAWQQVLWPLVGAYQVLTEDGLPVGVVNDQQLELGELDGYRLLVLPNADELTPAQQEAVAEFTAGGGAVIENDPAWGWSDPAGHEAAAAAFRAALEPHITAAPVRVTGGPPGRYAVSYRRGGRLVVAVTNDFSWVQIRWKKGEESRAAPPATGVRVTWRKGRGLPQARGRLRPLKAVEAITGRELRIEETNRSYRVDLPEIEFLALLVVTRELRRPFD